MNEHDERDELLVSADHEGAFAASGTPPMAIIGAVAAGIAGAAVWAGITLGADMEIGWIAWGIGAAIGAAYFKLGGRSVTGPALCAVIAVASIGAGKYAAFEAEMSNQRTEFFELEVMRMHFAGCQEFGKEYNAAATAADKEALERDWIVEVDADPATVSSEQLAEFREFELPELLAIHRGELSYEEFAGTRWDAAVQEVGVTFADTLGGFDLLWIALGVMTAWRLAKGTPE